MQAENPPAFEVRWSFFDDTYREVSVLDWAGPVADLKGSSHGIADFRRYVASVYEHLGAAAYTGANVAYQRLVLIRSASRFGA